MKSNRFPSIALTLIVVLSLLAVVPAAAAPSDSPSSAPRFRGPGPKFSNAVAFDVSPALRDLAANTPPRRSPPTNEIKDIRPDRGATLTNTGYSGDEAITSPVVTQSIPSPLANFEGLSNQDNFNTFGFRVNPPDPVGDVGPNHYVEMINLVFGVYDKQGNLLLGPVDTGTLWADFPVEDCTDPSGDPIVVYDQFVDRWLLTQFTTRGLDDPALPFYDCVAISQTGDPTGAYYRYAFITQPDPDGGYFFPDYPKYGVWTDSYVLTTRDFGLVNRYGISVYALEKNKMVNGEPDARAVQFFLDSDVVPLELIGDGLLPADIDGKQKPPPLSKIPIVGTQDDNSPYGATFDAVNIWDLQVHWRSTPTASLELAAQLPVASFDSIFPCAPTSRDCLPQPGITNTAQYLDVLSYRQRPTWRLAYRNFKGYESLVTTQTVEALPGVAGMRWYEIRRSNGGTVYPAGGSSYSLYQQGTYAPNDGVHRWMGSVAQDKQGNMALGYSVVNGVNVYPGIRYTGRLAGDPLGQMNLGEGTIIDGTGVQTTTNSRWGDYTSMNIDPVDDCTFWYVNEYYTAAGQASSAAGWQTRIASFKLPGCN
ncbi:MAG TPA: hypothetical protein VFY26_16150 [Anaerolineales bacterium]|nr:hypothetical protein [Anaerolineales bacterium]